MARHNIVNLYAQVLKAPTIVTNENGDYEKATALLNVISGKRNAEDTGFNDYTFACPVIITKDKNVISEMATWSENDMVFIKGTIATRDLIKRSRCPHCGFSNEKLGTVGYVNPIHAMLIKHMPDAESCQADLKTHCEISNQISIIGNVCEPPQFYESKNGKACSLQYNIAINRKYRTKEDPATITTDYPRVKSYGSIAVDDAKFLQVGATVFIDGKLSTRKFDKKCTCTNCNEEYLTPDRSIEIVPYAQEYLDGCRAPEEIESIENEDSDKTFEEKYSVATGTEEN